MPFKLQMHTKLH